MKNVPVADNEFFAITTINTSKISYAPEYQRQLSKPRAKRIAKGWNWLQYNEPKLNFRDGRYWCFDGQHTIQAAKIAIGGSDDADIDLRCKVYYALTAQEEAYQFVHQKDNCKSIGASELYKASLYAEEEVTVAYTRICAMNGVEVSEANGKNKCASPATLKRIFVKDGSDVLNDTLSLIVRTWGGDADSLTSKFITGVRDFIVKYSREYDKSNFINKCGAQIPSVILREAAGTVSEHPMRDRLLLYYNKGARNKIGNA